MIAAIGAHGASYSITIPQNAKVKAAIAATVDDDWWRSAYTRGGEAQVLSTTVTAGRRGDASSAAPTPSPSCAWSCAEPPARRPRAVAQLGYHCFADRHVAKPPTQTTAATPP